jgi:hypothetical protein
MPGRRSAGWDPRSYVPVHALPYWDHLGPFVREVVEACENDVERTPEALYAAVTPLAMWAWQVRGDALTIERVFRSRTVDEFVQRGMREYLPSSRTTIRSTLRRVLEHLAPHEAAGTGRKISRSAPTPPYSEGELGRMYAWAIGQSTPHRRLDALALLSLGCGAGLSTQELLAVTTADILDVRGQLAVQVGGVRAREVPLLPEWQRSLARVTATRFEGFIFRPLREASSAGQVTDFVLRARTTLDIRPARMRTTFLVRHLALGTHPTRLMRISGLSTLASLDRLRGFAPTSGLIFDEDTDRRIGHETGSDQVFDGPEGAA